MSPEERAARRPRDIRNAVLYSVFVLVLGLLGRVLDSVLGQEAGKGPGMGLWILAPLLVSFILRIFAGDGWAGFGLAPRFKGGGRSYALSALIYPACAVVVVLLGGGAIPEHTAAAFAVLLAPQLITNFFEEAGFRGYLTPKLGVIFRNALVGHVLVGIVWGAWHLPYLRAITPYTSEPLSTLVPRFILGAVAASLVYGEVRYRINSLWPAIVMQTVGGAFVGAVMAAGPLGGGLFFAPTIEGGLMIILFAAIGVALWWTRTRRPGTPEEGEER